MARVSCAMTAALRITEKARPSHIEVREIFKLMRMFILSLNAW